MLAAERSLMFAVKRSLTLAVKRPLLLLVALVCRSKSAPSAKSAAKTNWSETALKLPMLGFRGEIQNFGQTKYAWPRLAKSAARYIYVLRG